MTTRNYASGTIWTGDCLEVMRGMNSETVDLIYLDPPFNSNRDYEAPIGSKAAGAAFKDTWTLSDVDVHEHGELADRSPAAYAVIEAARQASGRAMMSYCIYMAVRLAEVRRLLKPTGSLYLHCDPTAGHYLKLLLDGLFGAQQFRNEITWQRTESHNTADRYGNVADTILFYARGPSPIWNGRRYRLDNLTAPRPDSDSGKFEWRGTRPGPSRGWGYRREQLEAWYAEGRIRLKRDGRPRLDGLKVYLDEADGKRLQNIWTDVPRIASTARERTGYPTQKPLALLTRIVEASSNPGDMVLEPFCGCATTLVAADRLGREWAGVDLSPLAIQLVNQRIADDRGPLWGGATALDRPPPAERLGRPAQLSHPPPSALRRAGGRLRRLRYALPLPRHGGRPHPGSLAGRDRPPRQPAAALLGLQPRQGRAHDGRVARRARP